MKQKLCMFAIHQTAISLQRVDNLNRRTIWCLALDESNRMKSAYFTILLSKNPPPHNGCQLKSDFLFFVIKNTGFTSSTIPIEQDFSQNQPAAITLNTSSPRTLGVGLCPLHVCTYETHFPFWANTWSWVFPKWLKNLMENEVICLINQQDGVRSYNMRGQKHLHET